ATGRPRDPAKPSEPRETRPMMRIACNRHGVGPARDGEQDNTTSALKHGIGDREGKPAAAADDGDRAVVLRRPAGIGHGEPSAAELAAAADSAANVELNGIISGREPLRRMNAITLSTNGSPAKSRSTSDRRSRKRPSRLNKAR